MAAINTVRDLSQRGFGYDDIYVLAKDTDSESGTQQADSVIRDNRIGIVEEGIFNSMASLFRTQGDELLKRLEAIGVTGAEAHSYVSELGKGRLLVIAKIS